MNTYGAFTSRRLGLFGLLLLRLFSSGRGVGRSASTTKRESVGLGAPSDSSTSSGVKEQFRVIVRVLRLNQTVQLGIFGGLLAEDGVSEAWWIGSEILMND